MIRSEKWIQTIVDTVKSSFTIHTKKTIMANACKQDERLNKKRYIIYRPRSVRIEKHCALGLEYSPRPAPSGRTLDLGHSLGKTQQKHTIFGLSCSYLKNTLVDPHLLSLESDQKAKMKRFVCFKKSLQRY